MTRPIVSVLLPIATPAPYLRDTLLSILGQSLDDWELVAVLDGPASTEATLLEELIPSSRLRLVELDVRQGLPAALNAGAAVARGEYIARIDADDTCLPTRLASQVSLLESNPEWLALGGGARLIRGSGEVIGRLPVKAGFDLRRSLLARNQLVHSSVMMRVRTLRAAGGYNPVCTLREDYELWLRIALLGPVFNTPETLVGYRVSSGQISRRRPPLRSILLVRRARLRLASSLGVGRSRAEVIGLLWALGQYVRIGQILGRKRIGAKG